MSQTMLFWAFFFLVPLLAICVNQARQTRTSETFLMADFRLGFWPLFGSVIATNVGAAVLIGSVAKGFVSGYTFAIVMIPQAIFVALLLRYYAPRIHAMRIRSIPDLICRRYGKKASILPSLMIAFVLMTPLVAMQLVGMGALMSSLFGIGFATAMTTALIITVLLCILGGLPAVTKTDSLQALWIFIGVAIVVTAILLTNSTTDSGVPADQTLKPHADVSSEAAELVNLLVLFGPFYLVWQTSWQRIAAARDLTTARRATAWGWAVTFLVFAASLWIGVQARELVPNDLNPEMVLSQVIITTVDPWLAGLLWSALFAAMLTGATSFLISGTVNLAEDLLPADLVKPEHKLWVSRISLTGLSMLGLLLALKVGNILAIYFQILALTTVVLFWTVIAAMSKRQWSANATIGSQIIGLLSAITWVMLDRPWEINEILPGLVAGGVALLAIDFLSPKRTNAIEPY